MRVSHFGKTLAIWVIILWMKYPLASYPQLNSLRHALAHCLRSGTVKAFFCLDKGLSTNFDLTDRTSMFFVYSSWEMASEKKVLRALVTEYKET